ncbi:hypothetical protein JCM14076_28960 [Methylosoma difficile]
MKTIIELSWPLSRLGEGIQELAKAAGLNPTQTQPLAVPEDLLADDSAELGRWLEWVGEHLGLQTEAVETPLPQTTNLLGHVSPAVLKINTDQGSRFLLLLKARKGTLQVIGPDLQPQRCKVSNLRDWLCDVYEAPIRAEIAELLSLADVAPKRRAAVQAVMLQERLANKTLGDCWLLRLPPTASFWQQLADAHLPRKLVGMLSVFTLLYGLEIIAWTLIGEAALNGRLDFGWLSAWALLVLSLIPLHAFGGWLDASFALEMGRILKKRLLAGALRLDLAAVKHQGAGQLLGRVMESQALESLALNGGFSVLIAAIELLFSAWILASGAAGLGHVVLLVGWLALTLGLSWRYWQRLRQWTLMRLDMSQDLVERMVGHRTCLAQESPQRRDNHEDTLLQSYLDASIGLDNSITPITGGLARGWLLVALTGLAPVFVAGTSSATALAISLGGILLANRALAGVSSGLAALARAGIAWQQVSGLFYAANKKPNHEPFLSQSRLADDENASGPLLTSSDVVFRYRPEGDAVLRGVNLSINHGDRILLQGASGGGKSTLASLLVGLRQPDSGLLLLNGLDRHTLGDSWHSLATEAPQFHENHILSGTLAFNLLMGSHWPASDDEMEEAKRLCQELGLGELLERMPSGMMQMVGETGWQLSHGERSRLFLARALLQNAQLTLLDESFAALDPESLEKCLACAFKRAKTLVVIAHP